MSDDLGPLYPAKPPATAWRGRRIIDAKFKVVLSPEERLARRLDRFEFWFTGLGFLLFFGLVVLTAPIWTQWTAAIDHTISAWLGHKT